MGQCGPGKRPYSGMWGVTNPPNQAALPTPAPCSPRLPARCTLRFLSLPKNRIGGCCQIKAAWRGTAWHGTARHRARREGLANKPVQGGGGREARVIPLPKMLLLLTDEAAESQEPRPNPASGAPPLPGATSPTLRLSPSLTHSPEDNGQGPRCHQGHLLGRVAGFRAPKCWAQATVTHRAGSAGDSPWGDIPVPPSFPHRHLLVAPASAPSASKAVRWLMSRAVPPPVPGLSPALAARCRGSPAAGLVVAVSRDEEDAWKRSRTETQRLFLH